MLLISTHIAKHQPQSYIPNTALAAHFEAFVTTKSASPSFAGALGNSLPPMRHLLEDQSRGQGIPAQGLLTYSWKHHEWCHQTVLGVEYSNLSSITHPTGTLGKPLIFFIFQMDIKIPGSNVLQTVK